MINKEIKDLGFPDDCLVALLRRDKQTIIPKGRTQVREGDRLTIIGEKEGLNKIQNMYME